MALKSTIYVLVERNERNEHNELIDKNEYVLFNEHNER